ncbi:MAG TPA: ATP-binding protein [Puia sp.]|jgi:signal transduction histidine kinase|nr:ATP-binding protein [Puia sp.]
MEPQWNQPVKILILEHDPYDLDLLQYELKKGEWQYVSQTVQERNGYEQALRTFRPDIVLSDYALPDFDGTTAFHIKKDISPDTPFIIVSGTIGEENAVELIKAGVTDYVLKDKLFTVVTKIGRALKESRERQQKKYQEEQLADYARELERSNRELQEFAYIASHDLQEPLRMVGSFLQLLQRRHADKLDKEANEYIHYAVDGAERMKRLISDLLNYSRTHKEQTIEKVDIGETIREALKNLTVSINDSGAMIQFEDMPVLHADPAQMLQLFQNLISNSIKFRKEGVIPLIKIAAIKDKEQWLFSVEDNGIGIDQQYAEKVFVIFKKLHSKAKFEGTGIGLAIAKKIVEQHGGKIWFESAPGKGTIFYFTLQSDIK